MGRGAGNIVPQSSAAKTPVEGSRNMNGRELNIAHNVGSALFAFLGSSIRCCVVLPLLSWFRSARSPWILTILQIRSGRGGAGNSAPSAAEGQESAAAIKDVNELLYKERSVIAAKRAAEAEANPVSSNSCFCPAFLISPPNFTVPEFMIHQST